MASPILEPVAAMRVAGLPSYALLVACLMVDVFGLGTADGSCCSDYHEVCQARQVEVVMEYGYQVCLKVGDPPTNTWLCHHFSNLNDAFGTHK